MYTYICIYTYIYICMYMYTYIFISRFSCHVRVLSPSPRASWEPALCAPAYSMGQLASVLPPLHYHTL